MGKTEDSPLPSSAVEPLRRSKRQKRVLLTFCRNLLESPPKALPRSPPTSPLTEGQLAAESTINLCDRDSSSSSSCISTPSAHNLVFDLFFLLDCDAISRDFLLPHLSFAELAALERTCKSLRDLIRARRWWRLRTDQLRREDANAGRLLARYSSTISDQNPDYHKKMISKLLSDTSQVVNNVKARTCRKSCKAFSLETTCHKAFTVHESGQFVFILDGGWCQVLSAECSKSKRGMELQPHRRFPVVQVEQYCSLLLTHRDWLFHVTYQQIHVWDWRRGNSDDGVRIQLESPSEKELLGLGLARDAVIIPLGGGGRGGGGGVGGVGEDCSSSVSAGANFLVVASNDAGEFATQPTTGAALIQIWRFFYAEDNDVNCEGNGASSSSLPQCRRRVSFALHDQIAEQPEKRDLPKDEAGEEAAGMKPTSICLDRDDGILAAAFGFFGFTRSGTVATGKISFFDVAAKKAFGAKTFPVAASCIRLNASQRKALVGFEKRDSESPYAIIVDIDSGDSLKRLRAKMWGPRCLWTDWKRLVFTGDDDGLLAWEIPFDTGDPGCVVDTDESTATSLSGCNGLPVTDRICDVFFDGFHLLVFTRGGQKATVRLLDFLKLNSVKF